MLPNASCFPSRVDRVQSEMVARFVTKQQNAVL
jgi:hypothetical protein